MDKKKASWHCINSKLYIFGIAEGLEMTEKLAGVVRRPDGEWAWTILDTHFQGVEPSRKRAMKKINKHFNSKLNKE